MAPRNVLQRTALVAGLVLASQAGALGAQQPLVSLRDLEPRELRSAAFVLAAPESLRIEAVGAEAHRDRGERGRDSDNWWWDDSERDTWPAAAWIIDARTRDVVWDLRNAVTRRSRSGVRRFEGTVTLPAGTYIAWYGSFAATWASTGARFDTRGIIRAVRGRRDMRYGGHYIDNGDYHDFALEIAGAGRAATAADLAAAERAGREATAFTIRPDRGQSSRVAFELPAATDVQLVAGGELQREDAFDYGWIMNADTRERVWTMTYARTAHAGGAVKNRLTRETLRLAAGRYVAYFVADDSHDPEEWNGVPAYDPDAWGLAVRVADAAARARLRRIEWEPVPVGQTIVSLIGVGNDQTRSAGFTLRRALDVRVYALGEGAGGDMDDYAWIVDADSRRRVWTMRRDDTQEAGGADKNRLFDGTMRLEAGSYLVYFRTDGSHAFGDWNSSPPAEARYWGISVFPADGRLDPAVVVPLERGRGTRGEAIAELVHMGNDVRARTRFRLEADATVRVYALGEGDGGDMYDYAWIEDAATGRTVWEMTYRTSEHAGGASKNRLFDGRVALAAGSYTLHYRSDGSHSWEDWNSDPPDDPEGWGVTILRAAGR